MYKQLFFVTIIVGCLENVLLAELLILKKDKTTNYIIPLSVQDSITHGFDICQVLLKYQWPMSLASDLTEEEKDELLAENKAYAEELFIEKKLRERIKEIDLVVVFLPTSLYELYELVEFFNSCKQDPDIVTLRGYFNRGMGFRLRSEGMINPRTGMVLPFAKKAKEDTSNEHANVFMKAVIAFNRKIKSNLHQFDNTITKALNESIANDKTANQIRKNIFKEYASINNSFYATDPLKKSEEPVMNFNFTIITFLSKHIPGFFNEQTRDALTRKIFEHRYKIIGDMVNDFNKVYKSFCLYDTHSHTSQLNINIISQVVDLEYQAQKINKALLFRGSSLIVSPIGKGQVAEVAGHSLHIPTDGIDLETEILKSYKNNSLPYSISLGNSLFAGYVNNQGGCAYSYMTMKGSKGENIGIILFINKKDQYEHDSSNLFFVPPLATVVSLFEYGVLFHPRVKGVVKSKSNPIEKIVGVRGQVFQDPSGTVIITRDPLKHTVLFSDFVTKNGVLITDSQEKSNNILQSQNESTKFYKSLNAIKNFLDSLIK